jgi:hypothetical protein
MDAILASRNILRCGAHGQDRATPISAKAGRGRTWRGLCQSWHENSGKGGATSIQQELVSRGCQGSARQTHSQGVVAVRTNALGRELEHPDKRLRVWTLGLSGPHPQLNLPQHLGAVKQTSRRWAFGHFGGALAARISVQAARHGDDGNWLRSAAGLAEKAGNSASLRCRPPGP